MDSKNVMSTASAPIHQEMPKKAWPSQMQTSAEAPVPATNHEPGTSTAASGSSLVPRCPKRDHKPLKARTTVRQRKANARRPDATIIAVAGHRVQDTIPL